MLVRRSKLVGEVTVSGAKNSALCLLVASILTDEPVTLLNFPHGLFDVKIQIKMLEALGKQCESLDNAVTFREGPQKLSQDLLWDERSVRHTLLILGALTARFGRGRVPLPGGCKLGERKYDLHVMLLERLGARVWEENGYLCAEAKKGGLEGAEIHLPIRSTGATENAILCGALARGTTTVWNPHVRPEILDLVHLLRRMGAKIEVKGQMCIQVTGVEGLTGAVHTVIPDNMEALTWAIGTVVTGGDVEIHGFPFDHLEVPLIYLRESGMKYFRGDESLIVRGGKAYPVEISTGPYPGINSDMQPLFAIYGAMSKGESKVVDLRFPGRYGYAEELAKMGVSSKVVGDMLVIEGGNSLTGAEVRALDLRAGAALLLAGLAADGETRILDDWQITRGYEYVAQKLQSLGAHVG